MSNDTAPSASEPAPIPFKPFAMLVDGIFKTLPANIRCKQVANGAIVLASAASIAWALPHARIVDQKSEQPAAMAVALFPVHAGSTRAANDGSDSSPAAASFKPSAGKAAVLLSLPAPPSAVAASAIVASTVNARSPATTMALVGKSGFASAGDGSARATKPHAVALIPERDQANVRAKPSRFSAAKPEARSYEVVQGLYGHECQGALSGFDASLASPGHHSQQHDEIRTASSLSVAEMHNMLAHSAVLDDNSGAVRQPVGAAQFPHRMLVLRILQTGVPTSANGKRSVTDPVIVIP